VPRTPPPSRLRSAALARLAGVSVDTLRHYENKGLLPAPPRTPSGYREYPQEALGRVRLVRRAVALGFTLDELARVFAVRDRGGAPCRSVRALAQSKLATIESRLAALAAARDLMQAVLARWDDLLDAAPPGGRAGLLDALEDVIEEGTVSPLVPEALGRTRR
jgi:MerR family transcriptional regulator, copper efflux regulator